MAGATNVGFAVVVSHVVVHDGFGPLSGFVRPAHLGVVDGHGPALPNKRENTK